MELNWGITLLVALAIAAFFTAVIQLVLYFWEHHGYEDIPQEEVDDLLSTDGKTPEEVADDFIVLASKGYFRHNIIKIIKYGKGYKQANI